MQFTKFYLPPFRVEQKKKKEEKKGKEGKKRTEIDRENCSNGNLSRLRHKKEQFFFP